MSVIEQTLFTVKEMLVKKLIYLKFSTLYLPTKAYYLVCKLHSNLTGIKLPLYIHCIYLTCSSWFIKPIT